MYMFYSCRQLYHCYYSWICYTLILSSSFANYSTLQVEFRFSLARNWSATALSWTCAQINKILFFVILLYRGLRIAFNSVGAFASVNHLHFHALYINHPLPIENAEVLHITGGCYEIVNSHTRGFAFQLYGQSPDSLAKLLFRVVSLFVESEIPHNLFMCRANVFPNNQKGRTSEPLSPDSRESNRATVQVFLWPRKPTFGANADIAFQSASIEPAGFLLMKDPNQFDHLKEEEAIRILESFSMSEEEFNVIKEQVLERLNALTIHT